MRTGLPDETKPAAHDPAAQIGWCLGYITGRYGPRDPDAPGWFAAGPAENQDARVC